MVRILKSDKEKGYLTKMDSLFNYLNNIQLNYQ